MTEEQKKALCDSVLVHIQSAQTKQSTAELQALFVQIKSLFSGCADIDKEIILNAIFQDTTSFSRLKPNTAKFLVQKLVFFYHEPLYLRSDYSSILYEKFCKKSMKEICAKAEEIKINLHFSALLSLLLTFIPQGMYACLALNNLLDASETLTNTNNLSADFKKSLFNPNTQTKSLSLDIELLETAFSGNIFILKKAIKETINEIKYPEQRLLLLKALQDPRHPLCTIMDIKQNPFGITNPAKNRDSGSRSDVKENIYRTEQEIIDKFKKSHPSELYPFLQQFLDTSEDEAYTPDDEGYTQMVPLKSSTNEEECKESENRGNTAKNIIQFSCVYSKPKVNNTSTELIPTTATTTNQTL